MKKSCLYNSDIEVELKRRGINFTVRNNYIYVDERTYAKLKINSLKYLDVDQYLNERNASSRKKRSIKQELLDRGLVLNNVESLILQKCFVNLDVEKLLNSMYFDVKKYITKHEIYSQYHIPTKKIEDLIVSGALKTLDGNILRDDFEKAQRDDAALIPIEEYVFRLEKIHDISLTKKLIDVIIKDYVKNSKNTRYKTEEKYVGALKSKYNIYVNELDEEVWAKLLKKNSCHIKPINYTFMWKCLDEAEILMIHKTLTAIPFQPNEEMQPKLHNIMSVIISQKKHMRDWTDSDVEIIRKTNNNAIYKSICRILDKMKTQYPETKYIGNMAQFTSKASTTNSIPPYSLDQYLDFGYLIFGEDSYERNCILSKILDDSECAQSILYAALHYCGAWRNPDIYTLATPRIDSLDTIISKIESNELDNTTFISIWVAVKITLQQIANKNKQNIELFVPEEFEPKIGIMIAVCEYHRLRDGRLSLVSKVAVKYRTFFKLFEGRYIEIFGKKCFSGHRLNKDYLAVQAIGASLNLNLGIRCLPELVAAYIRGHKFDWNRGPNTIFHYIGHKSEGMCMDDVAYELLRIGTMGHFKELVIRLCFEKYPKLQLPEKSTLINAVNINPAKLERELELLQRNQKSIINVSKYGFDDDGRKMVARIQETIGASNANEPNVYCLYTALTGHRNEKCIGQNVCDGCGDEEGFCKYGIYFVEYLTNILTRINYFSNRLHKLSLLLQEESDMSKITVIANEIGCCKEAKTFLRDRFDTFIKKVNLSNDYKEMMIQELGKYIEC